MLELHFDSTVVLSDHSGGFGFGFGFGSGDVSKSTFICHYFALEAALPLSKRLFHQSRFGCHLVIHQQPAQHQSNCLLGMMITHYVLHFM